MEVEAKGRAPSLSAYRLVARRNHRSGLMGTLAAGWAMEPMEVQEGKTKLALILVKVLALIVTSVCFRSRRWTLDLS